MHSPPLKPKPVMHKVQVVELTHVLHPDGQRTTWLPWTNSPPSLGSIPLIIDWVSVDPKIFLTILITVLENGSN
jgi:hypothetical protein